MERELIYELQETIEALEELCKNQEKRIQKLESEVSDLKFVEGVE